jgi:hypothetical protein
MILIKPEIFCSYEHVFIVPVNIIAFPDLKFSLTSAGESTLILFTGTDVSAFISSTSCGISHGKAQLGIFPKDLTSSGSMSPHIVFMEIMA